MSYSIITGNCLGAIDLIDSASVDVVITDPPYGDTNLGWDKVVANWLPPLHRILKPHGSVWFFTSLRHLMLMDLRGWKLAQDLVWEKHNGSGFLADRFRRVHEHIVHIYPEDVPWKSVYKMPVTTPTASTKTVLRKKYPPHFNKIARGTYESVDGGPLLMRSVIPIPSCHGYAVHPTQKPVDIITPLVQFSCPPGGLVLDPFCGSGSTGVSALTLQRSFLGIELNAAYADISRSRCLDAFL